VPPSASTASPGRWADRWRRFARAALRAFHAYASWLVSLSWLRFVLLAVMLVIVVEMLQSLPPFRWSVVETIENGEEERSRDSADERLADAKARADRIAAQARESAAQATAAARAGATQAAEAAKAAASQAAEAVRRGSAEAAAAATPPRGVEVRIDDTGVRILAVPPAAASGASAPLASIIVRGASGTAPEAPPGPDDVVVSLPPGLTAEAVREALAGVREALAGVVEDKRAVAEDLASAARDLEQARLDIEEAARDAASEIAGGPSGKIRRITQVSWGDFMTDLALLWILASALIKATYKGRMQAEVKAARAAETAESESLKRQVVEARMAAMQAQVEPHFLFNTLASIDHLIETDPARASQMQRNLIALLRASMPTMRETADGTSRDLGRELSVIRPYLEILKVRMEERLATEVRVPDGLLSAEFPSMMIQTLVENAIKHGLEPKPEGGTLTVAAEVVHGKLAVSVADTGLGFGRAATAGTGVGLANVRERLQLLYGSAASLAIVENPGGGTVVTITVPYRSVAGSADVASAAGAAPAPSAPPGARPAGAAA
jgi:signal transduction histidine kinase